MNPPTAETCPPASLWTSMCTKYMKYIGWGIAIVVCVTLASVLHRAMVNGQHEDECKANLRRIGVALLEYHDRCGSFPPAYVLSEHGQRWHSWRVLLLPDLGYTDLHNQYSFDEPWNGPHNRQLLARMPSI